MSQAAELFILESNKSFHGLKSNTEKAMAQLEDSELHWQPDSESNSVAILIQHMAGNMKSRFTDFFSSDGEKSNRNRDAEFIDVQLTRSELLDRWQEGWNCLFDVLRNLKEEDLSRNIRIKGEEQSVIRAMQRHLTHYSYHCGQIVFLCKQIRKENFKSLSIPRTTEKKH